MSYWDFYSTIKTGFNLIYVTGQLPGRSSALSHNLSHKDFLKLILIWCCSRKTVTVQVSVHITCPYDNNISCIVSIHLDGWSMLTFPANGRFRRLETWNNATYLVHLFSESEDWAKCRSPATGYMVVSISTCAWLCQYRCSLRYQQASDRRVVRRFICGMIWSVCGILASFSSLVCFFRGGGDVKLHWNGSWERKWQSNMGCRLGNAT